MPIKQLSSEDIRELAGTRHSVTGFEYPPAGLQPYYEWIVRTLHLLSEASVGQLRVSPDESGATVIIVAPGRASISDVPLDYAGETIDLSQYNNSTVYVWLEDDGGSASVNYALSTSGWPTGAHIKLAEVTLAGGAIIEVLDKRFETILRV